MLSPGRYHEKVPKDRRQNLRFRRFLLTKCQAEPAYRCAVTEMCRQDLLFYVNAMIWTFDPEAPEKTIPFITWPAQDAALKQVLACVEDQRDLIIEKSRRQGGSWLFLMAMEWLWRFFPQNQFLMVSRDAQAVDCSSPDSLFWKIDFLHSHLPGWLCDPKSIRRKKMFIGNRQNGSVMTGQASTEKAGIGGRATAMFVDEFARIDRDQEVLDGTADTSRCRIFNSTHTGPGTAFFRLTERENIRKLRLHWSDNPYCNPGLYQYDEEKKRVRVIDKSYVYPSDFNFVLDGKLRSPWYDGECERRGNSRAIAMDLDIDARGSMSQFFDPAIIRRLVGEWCREPSWQGDILFDKETGRPERLVERQGGPLKLWLTLTPQGTPPLAAYAFGADISQGTGATPSCLAGGDCKTGEKLIEYTNAHIDANSLAPVATALAWLFCGLEGEPAKLCWEQQGPGVAFGGKVLELGFRNVYYRTKEVPYSLAKTVSQTPGWVNNPESKMLLLEDYRSALAMRKFLNPSKAALDECASFRYTTKGTVEHATEASTNDPTGARQNHGDHVIADALLWKMMKAHGQLDKATRKQEIPALSFAGRREKREAKRRDLVWA